MSAQVSFWNRMTTIFRPSANGGNGHAAPAGEVETNGHKNGETIARSPLALRYTGQNAPAKRDAGVRLAELMDAMERHFDRQEERAQRLNDSLDKVASTLGQLAQAQTTQGDSLRTIAGHAEASGRSAARLSDTLASVPASLQSQADAVRSMVKQMQITSETDQQLTLSLERFGVAVDGLSKSSRSQVDALERLSGAEREQKDALTALVREQGRRFLWMMGIVSVLALGALVTLGVILARAL